jgi:hypothetical protein
VDEGMYYSTMSIKNRQAKFCYEIINAYGSAKEREKDIFCRNYIRKYKEAIVH